MENNTQELKALSWKEPFASLMLHGKIETRTWHTHYRGKVLICSSQKPYSKKQILAIMGFGNYSRWQKMNLEMLNGHAIAIGTLIDCRPMTEDDVTNAFVKYNPDLYCHVYEDVRAIEPIPFKGQVGWKNMPADFEYNFIK